MFLAKAIKLILISFFVGLVSFTPLELQPKQNTLRSPASLISKSKLLSLPLDKEDYASGDKVSILLSQKCLSLGGSSGFLREQLSRGLKLKPKDWQTVAITIEKNTPRRDLQSLIDNDPCIFEMHYPSRAED